MTPQIDTPAVFTAELVSASSDEQQLVVLDTGIPHLRVAVATTAQGGLQTSTIDTSAQAAAGPVRAVGQRLVTDVDSFLAELGRRPLTPGVATIWGSMDQGRIVAVYDDHPADGGANWRDDRLLMELEADDDWKAWHALSGQWMRQDQFADAIEELLHTVVSPDQADLMEVIASVRASTKGTFESRQNRANGSISVGYSQEVTAKAGRRGELEVPEQIQLRLRPWAGQEQTYVVGAYFRLLIADGDLRLAIKLKPTRQILRQAWNDQCAQIVDALGDEFTILASTRL